MRLARDEVANALYNNVVHGNNVAVQMRRPRHGQLRQTAALGLLAAGERLRPEGEPRELSADHLQLVLRAGFVEPVDQRD